MSLGCPLAWRCPMWEFVVYGHMVPLGPVVSEWIVFPWDDNDHIKVKVERREQQTSVALRDSE